MEIRREIEQTSKGNQFKRISVRRSIWRDPEKCVYCNSPVSQDEKQCDSCGAPNKNYIQPLKWVRVSHSAQEHLRSEEHFHAHYGMPYTRITTG